MVVATSAFACSGGPTSPNATTAAGIVSFRVSCSASVIYVGQIDVCAAVVYLSNGLPQDVGAVWSSSNLFAVMRKRTNLDEAHSGFLAGRRAFCERSASRSR